MSQSKKNLVAGVVVAAALSSQSPAMAQDTPVESLQNKTQSLTGELIHLDNGNDLQASIGSVNHGREMGASVELAKQLGYNTIVKGAVDKSQNEAHAILGLGHATDNAYFIGTVSWVQEKHYNHDLRGYGASLEAVLVRPSKNIAEIGWNVSVHQGKSKTLDTKESIASSQQVEVVDNKEITTTTTTTTNTTYTFNGKTLGEASAWATMNVGQNGELRAEVAHAFGDQSSSTYGKARYTHYFNNNASSVYFQADTKKRYESGLTHQLPNSNFSVGTMVFSEDTLQGRNNGWSIGLTYAFGGNKTPQSLRRVDARDPEARMNARMMQIDTNSPEAVKHVNRLGDVTAHSVVASSQHVEEKLFDTKVTFSDPQITVDDDIIRVDNHGIYDRDGVKDVIYIFTGSDGSREETTNPTFRGRYGVTYTITITAKVKDAEMETWKEVENSYSNTITLYQAIVNSPVDFIKPSIELQGSTVVMKDVGVIDSDGVRNEGFIVYDETGKEITRTNEKQITLPEGKKYTIVTIAEVYNPETWLYNLVKNDKNPIQVDIPVSKVDQPTTTSAPIIQVNGNTITVTNHGISDQDGIENVQYTLTTKGGTTVTNNTGIFTGLVDGEYTITTTAEVKNGEKGIFSPAINPHATKVTVGQSLKEQVDAFMTSFKKDVRVIDANVLNWYDFDFTGLPDWATVKVLNIRQHVYRPYNKVTADYNETTKILRAQSENNNWGGGNALYVTIDIEGNQYELSIDFIVG